MDKQLNNKRIKYTGRDHLAFHAAQESTSASLAVLAYQATYDLNLYLSANYMNALANLEWCILVLVVGQKKAYVRGCLVRCLNNQMVNAPC